MKRIFTFFLTILLSICFTLPAFALTNPGFNGGTSTDGPVILCGSPEDLQKDIIILEETDVLDVSHFPMGNLYGYLDINGKGQILPVEWDLSDEVLLTPGLHEVKGTPVLSEGFALAEGYDGIVTWPVFRKGGNAKLSVTSLEQVKVSSPLMPISGDPTTDLTLPSKLNNCITESGYTLSTRNDPNFGWTWDVSSIDISALGKYTITAQLKYPDWVSVPAELQSHTADIYVLPTDRIEIYAPPTAISRNGTMDIRWLYEGDNVTDVLLEQKNTDGQWVICDESWGGYVTSVYARDYLKLCLTAMPKDTPLTLRLRYQDVVNDVPTERTTEAIQLTIPANILELLKAGNASIPVTVIEGDRDGSDSTGTPLPDQEQPAPSRKKKNKKSTKKIVTEIVTDTYTAISGLRVDALTDTNNTVLFEKQKVSAEIPSRLLENLKLKDQELLEVALLRPSETSFLIAVYAKGKLVEDISGTKIYLPWDAKNGTSLRCVDIWGNFVSNGIYDNRTGTVCFSVPTPNTYFIRKQPSHHPSPFAVQGVTS